MSAVGYYFLVINDHATHPKRKIFVESILIKALGFINIDFYASKILAYPSWHLINNYIKSPSALNRYKNIYVTIFRSKKI